MRSCVLVISLFLAVTFSEPAHAENMASTISGVVSELRAGENFQGNILVKSQGKVIYQESFGLANQEHEVPHGPETKFMIASMTKQFTAAAIHQLVGQGRLRLADSIADYLPLETDDPSKATRWTAVTIGDLLSHQSGLLKDLQPSSELSLSEQQTLAQIVKSILAGPILLVKSRGSFAYSNVGYVLLARVIELVSGFSYEDYLKYRILDPIGMENTGSYHRSKILPNMAGGYYLTEELKLKARCCVDASVNAGSHNLYSSAPDLMAWIEEITGAHDVISSDFINKLYHSAVAVEEGLGYANGLFFGEYEGHRHVWHDGYEAGYNAMMSHFPELQLSIVILSNWQNPYVTPALIRRLHDGIASAAISSHR